MYKEWERVHIAFKVIIVVLSFIPTLVIVIALDQWVKRVNDAMTSLDALEHRVEQLEVE